ncbi:MAG: hypothetical protein ACYS0I_20915 [Planctomycetota bacterium]
MMKQFLTAGRLVILGLACALSFAVATVPAWGYHKEQKTVKQVVSVYTEIHHHMQKGGLDWHHLGEELAGIAKPIRALGHHDNVDLFKPLEDSIRRQDKEALEEAFHKIFIYLIRENLHLSEDNAGKLEKTLTGYIENARIAYGPLAAKPDSADDRVKKILKEMDAIAQESRALKAKLAEKKKELEAQLGKMQGH